MQPAVIRETCEHKVPLQLRLKIAPRLFQLELSRNFLFLRGTTMDEVYQKLIDRTRASLSLEQLRLRSSWESAKHRQVE